jgi:phosphoesterase RecJ-like protein
MIPRIAELLRKHNKFLVTTHRNPDGDAVGCLTGMGRILGLMGKEFVLHSPDPLPLFLRFLHLADKVVTRLPPDFTAELTIAVDVADPALLAPDLPGPERRGKLVVIDHHLRHTPFGDVVWRDTETAAVGVLLYRLTQHLGLPDDLHLAEALWCSIYTDTGGFRYSGTNSEALRIAAHLLDQGVDPWQMATAIYESNPASRVTLLARVLDTLTLTAGGKIALITVTKAMLKEARLDASMLDTFINHARGIEGVELAIQLAERGTGWKVSLRSKGNVDASALAAGFGGGGHRNAAGCSIQGTLEEARAKVMEAAVNLVSQTTT